MRHLYRSGPDLTPILQTKGNEALFLMVAGQRRPLTNREEAFALGYGVEQISQISADFLAQFPLESDPTYSAPTEVPPTATPCPQPIAEILIILTNDPAQAQLGCPTSEALITPAAWQSFEHGQLLWRSDRKVIYILGSDGHWFFVGDTWEDGDEEIDPSIIPDEGFYQPKTRLWQGVARAARGAG